jgi:hypothetical protein
MLSRIRCLGSAQRAALRSAATHRGGAGGATPRRGHLNYSRRQHGGVVDEIGYLPISRTGAMLFFQLMTRCYEHASTTSNDGFEERGDIFGDDVMAAALIDRRVHHCHLVTIRGNSYRMRQHSELWQTLHTAHEPSGGHDDLRLVRRARLLP